MTFILNKKPIFIQNDFVSLMNGKDFSGWHTWLKDYGKNNDPNHIFIIEADGVMHDLGKDLVFFSNAERVLDLRKQLGRTAAISLFGECDEIVGIKASIASLKLDSLDWPRG